MDRVASEVSLLVKLPMVECGDNAIVVDQADKLIMREVTAKTNLIWIPFST